MKAWLNGRFLEGSSQAFSIDDRGLLLGDGLYETIRVADSQATYLDQHLRRLSHGTSVIGSHPDISNIPAAIASVISANGLKNGSVRITFTRGSGPRGLLPADPPHPNLLITAFPASPPPKPARVIIASSTRRNEYSPLSRIKSTNCLDNIIARLEARDRAADDAILLNTAGRIAEASAANIFALIDNIWLTPPLTDGVLPGITRARILASGGREASLTIKDLMQAKEIILTSSLGIREVCLLDNSPLLGGAAASFLSQMLFG